MAENKALPVTVRDPRDARLDSLNRQSYTTHSVLPPATLPNVESLAAAMCVTSHHGLTRTEWPCDYHRERAKNVLAHLDGKRLVVRQSGVGEGDRA